MERSEKYAVTAKRKLGEYDEELEAALYWQSRTPEERFAEVERLRREHWGPEYDSMRFSRSAPIVKRKLGEPPTD